MSMMNIEIRWTEVSDPNVALETITSQKFYLSLKSAEKEAPANNTMKKVVELTKPIGTDVYKDYNDQTRDRMIEGPMERGKVTLRWSKYYEETGEDDSLRHFLFLCLLKTSVWLWSLSQ